MISKNTLLMGFVSLTMFIVASCDSENGSLSVDPIIVEFGSIYIGNYTDIEVKITNEYKKKVILKSIDIPGNSDFSVLTGGTTPVEIAEGGIHKVSLRFSPLSKGLQNNRLCIEHNQSSKQIIIELTGTGLITPLIDVPVKNYDFGKILINTTSSHSFEVSNTGTDTLILDTLNLVGSGAALYSIISGGSTPVNIVPGGKHTIKVQFAPITAANYNTTLEIGHNAKNDSDPVTIIIDGEGIKPDPQITLSQSSPWDFGLVKSTSPKTEVCDIKNTGKDPLTVSSATLTNNAEFTIESVKNSSGSLINFPQIIAVSDKITVEIKFAPTATANFKDTLNIVHNGTNSSSLIKISIEGQGQAIVTQTFKYSGLVQKWAVPAGVTNITFEVYGAEGGDSTTVGAGVGGLGGKVTGQFSVSKGDVLYIYVGGMGESGKSSGAGGWNGGGNGEAQGTGMAGGGGGGASDIRLNSTDIGKRIVVAGGGGGGGASTKSGEAGGNGGDLTGKDGDIKCGGKGGTQKSGGAGGDDGSGRIGDPGKLGTGGNAYPKSTGGGGGGGYYGGGGGSPEAGGGGSSYTEKGVTNVKHTQGVQTGDGKIVITY